MRLLYVFAAIVGAVSGARQSATEEAIQFVDAIPSEGFINEDGSSHTEHVFDTDKEGRCLTGLYIGKGLDPTGLYEVNSGATALEILGDGDLSQCKHYSEEEKISYNAIGYDSKTNFVYGVTDHEHDIVPHHIVRIDRHGCTEPVANLLRLPEGKNQNGRHLAGDVHNGKTLWVAKGKYFRAVELSPVEVKISDGPPAEYKFVHGYKQYTFPNCKRMNDFAFSPEKTLDGDLNNLFGEAFGWSNLKHIKDADGKITSTIPATLCRFTPGPGPPEPEELGDMGIDVSGKLIGGFFFDSEGSVFMYANIQDQLYKYTGLDAAMKNYGLGDCSNDKCKVELAAGYPLTLNDDGPTANNVDGCSCVTAAGGFTPGPPTDDRCFKREL